MNLIMLTMIMDRRDSVQGFAHEWARVLGEKLDELHVIGQKVGEYDLPENISVYSMGKEKGASRLRKTQNLVNHARSIISDNDIDGIFVHQIELYGLCIYPLAKLNNIPLIQFKAHKGVPFTLWIAKHLFDHFVTSSEGGLELNIQNKTVIGQGIDTDRFAPDELKQDHQGIEISTIGRISPVKDYKAMLESVKELKSRIESPVRFRIVGEPATDSDKGYLKQLKDYSRTNDLKEIVEFTGPLTNFEVVQIYQESDLFLNMSKTGSLDKAILEAMACECPVITCNWAYKEIFPESLIDELIVEPEDPQQLTEKMESLLKKPEKKRRELGQRLRGIVKEEHNLDQLMENVMSVFRNVRDT